VFPRKKRGRISLFLTVTIYIHNHNCKIEVCFFLEDQKMPFTISPKNYGKGFFYVASSILFTGKARAEAWVGLVRSTAAVSVSQKSNVRLPLQSATRPH
jgi:hypothetical protein